MGSEVQESHMMVGGNGNSLEIFVFSNGQQDSPPRKYNLRVNERWDSTMNYLAQSQYGSRQTVNLYTIEGKKIEGPLELSDGGAYVAVQPPEPFASAGYQQYLMKASRSREKRQERISEKESLIKSVKLNIEDIDEEDHKDATNNKKVFEDLTIVSPNAIVAEDNDAVTDKVKKDIIKAVRPIRRISVIKQPQKRNSYLPQHNSSVIRKSLNNVTPPVRKINNTSGVDAIKKKFETSPIKTTKNIVSSVSINYTNGKTSNVRSNKRESNEPSVLKRESDVMDLPSRKFACLEEKLKLTVDSSTSTTSAVIERHILPVSVDSEYEHLESELINVNQQLSNGGTDYDSINGVAIPSKNEKHVRTIINSTTKSQDGTSNTKVINKGLEELSQNETLMFGSQTGENNFSIYVKKGGTVNLKLNIEVKNGSSAGIETNHSYHLKQSTSVASTQKTDRGTLANSTNVAHNGRGAAGAAECCLGGLPLEQLQQMTKELKFAVCGINCCPCPGLPERPAPVYVDNNNYIILLPPDAPPENSASSTRKLEMNQKCESDDQVLRISNSNKNLTLEEDLNKDATNVAAEKHQSLTSVPNANQILSKDVSVVEVEVNQMCDCCKTCKILNLPPACNCAPRILKVCENEPPAPSNLVVKKQPSFSNNCNIYKEAYTQTVWTCVVLEARPRGDGSYAFHLPSLEILKLCNVLY